MNKPLDQKYSNALEWVFELLTVPDEYTLVTVQSQKQNRTDVWVFRFEKRSGENNGLGGEHFSVVVEKNNYNLLGFTWMDQRLTEGKLPSKEETTAIARAFLEKVEPGMFEKLQNLWIDRHDEVISLTGTGNIDKRTVTVSGMKYKCYLNEKDDYAWVIVGPGGRVITFEQGIVWNNGRVTEKWLHDSWLKPMGDELNE
ncbi:YcdB/YcdC domain-containing protein [Brevibacillus sp. SYSU BS000544]|uniref:YcdB/YcdC domain-containing protein n=1 Tax=Brevibacillus sp. SYSU BS000544 TaxID=3416443 RepID=UPI003CE4D1DF